MISVRIRVGSQEYMSTDFHKLEVIEFENEDQMFEDLQDILGNIEELESFLDVEFAFVDGTFHSDNPPSDDENEIEDWENQEIDFKNRRPKNGYDFIGFPKSFPAKLFILQLSFNAGSSSVWCRWADDLEPD